MLHFVLLQIHREKQPINFIKSLDLKYVKQMFINCKLNDNNNQRKYLKIYEYKNLNKLIKMVK